MELIVGEKYYFLTQEEYDYLLNNGGASYLTDFEKINGIWYAPVEKIDNDEDYDFLLEYELANYLIYAKSTQNWGPKPENP